MPKREEIDRTNAAYEQMEKWRRLPRALSGGLEEILRESFGKNTSGRGPYAVSGGGSASSADTLSDPILPQSEESDDMYVFRAKHLTEPPTDFDDAVANIVGTILPEPVKFDVEQVGEAMLEQLERFWANVDNQGAQGDAFVKDRGEEAATEGLSAIFVDVVDDEASPHFGRPYWKAYDARSIRFNRLAYDPSSERIVPAEVDLWDKTSDGQRRVLRFFRGNPAVRREEAARGRQGSGQAHYLRYVTFEEYVEVPDAERGEDEYEQIDHGGPNGRGVMLPPLQLPNEIEVRFVEIPLYPLYSGYISPWYARPRIGKLAELCRIKMTLQSGHYAALYYSVPREVIKGMTREQYEQANKGEGRKAGGGYVQFISNAEGDYGFAEPEGHVFGAVQAQIEALQARIDRAAFQVMSERATGSELTATGIVAAENRRVVKLDVDHAWWRQGIGSALSRAAYYIAAFKGLTHVESLPFQMPSAKRSALLDPETTARYAQVALQSDRLGIQTYARIGQEIGTWPEGVTPEEALQDLQAEQMGVGGDLTAA